MKPFGSNARVAVTMVAASLALGACSLLGLPLPMPDDISGGDVYVGEDASTITVTTRQEECCYIEGSLRFAALEGPSSFDWPVDDGTAESDSGNPLDGYIVGVQAHSVSPGDYVLTAWEQVCSGNCGNLDEPSNHCTLEFTVGPGDEVEILVVFTIPEPCVATIET